MHHLSSFYASDKYYKTLLTYSVDWKYPLVSNLMPPDVLHLLMDLGLLHLSPMMYHQVLYYHERYLHGIRDYRDAVHLVV